MIAQRRRRRRALAHEITTMSGGGAGERRVVVSRGTDGAGGFGFTIAGQRPCVISCVAADGGAERAGLRPGDLLLAVEGANVTRVEHEMVARMIAAAPAHITLTVAAPDDHSDTSEEERTRQPSRYRQTGRPHTRAPRRRPHYAATTAPLTYDNRLSCTSEAHESTKASYNMRETSSKNIFQLIDGSQAMPLYKESGRGRLECRVVVGYLGTIESPHMLDPGAEPAAARHAVRRLRHERRVPAAAAVLLVVTPVALALRRAAPAAPPLACYPRDRLRGAYAACSDDTHAETDARHFALLTRSPPPGAATGCHVFVVDEGLVEHHAHAETARRFGVTCTLDPISGRCLEFPASATYVVDLVRCMYSLPAPLGPGARPTFARAPAPRSPQPSNHSERTTGSSNSDSGIGFHNECTDVAERILVVEFERVRSAHYDPVCTDSEGHHYETIGPKARARGGAAVAGLRRAQASLDDMLLARDDNFVHPAAVGARAPRRGPRPSASAGDVCAPGGTASADGVPGALHNASSAPDLRPPAGERASPFRRWTTSATASAAGGERGAGAPEGDGAHGGRVARWSLGLEQLLADEAGAGAFAAFLAKEFAVENIRFWNACERYAAAVADERERAAAALWERHLADGAPEPVNVDAAARRAADPQRAPRPPPADLFRSAQNQIFNLMKFDSYPRFLRSSLHAECARADLRGQPLPYAPAPVSAPPSALQDQTKLKKSASNASERRRSGGSLLPWARLRAASRDRDRDRDRDHDSEIRAPSPASGGGPVTVGCSLCRVVLPDGATSVVGVEAGVSVRALVDRLLARRALPAAAYDVLVTGDADAVPVDVDTPSTVLGGRQATVERRCVFRLELGGRRAVGVRCRPGKRLRHVLRPVLAKYAPAAATEPLVLRDGRPVPLDTRVQEVDGARLQLAGLGEQPAPTPAAAPPRTPEHDDEREPLSVRAALRPAPAPASHAAPPLPPKPRLPGPAPAPS